MASIATIQLPALTKRSMTQLVNNAKRKGIDPGDYAKKLIEHGLELEHEAQTMSIAEIMAPVRAASGEVSDEEIVALVDLARTEHARVARRKKR